MPTIDMSPGLAAGISSRMLKMTNNNGISGISPARAGLLQGNANEFTGYGPFDACRALIFLMKGTVPTDANFTTVSQRSSDILVAFSSNSAAGGGDFETSQATSNPATISTRYVTAGASGTATWFWWVVAQGTSSFPYYIANDANFPLHHQIVGTIGTTGSGADLEMPTVAITAGQQYRIMNFRVQFPTTWTY